MKKLERNIIRYKIIEKHIELVKNGEYYKARLLLFLLNEKELYLGLNDDCFYIDCFLGGIGLKARYTRHWQAVYKLK